MYLFAATGYFMGLNVKMTARFKNAIFVLIYSGKKDTSFKKAMTILQQTAFKKELQKHCVSIIEERIAATQALMNSAQEAANSESKSSAGDKYETTRAMNHLQKDMYATQLAANRLELAALMNINCSSIATTIGNGCFVQTATTSFFIAAGLGKIKIDGITVYLLSPKAPLTQVLITKKIADSFLFNKELLVIENIF